MADVQRRTGSYTISAKSTELFEFWWPVDKNHPHDLDNAYFDVSIAPELDNENAVITPLVEVKRERTFFFDEPWRSFTNKTLWLTLQNDNDFPVKFLAAHVLIN